MKILQFIGTKEKADFTLYISNLLTVLNQRVLVVDATASQIYRYGYLNIEDQEQLTEIQKVEVLCGVKDWDEVNQALKKNNEKVENYDCIIIDIDSINGLLESWPEIDDRYYFSDDDRYHLNKDVPLLHRYFDEADTVTIKRIHFESPFKLREDYLDQLMNSRPDWSPLSYTVEYDDFEERLKLQMQHEQIIPLKELSKSLKSVMEEIISEQFQFDIGVINNYTKSNFFSKFGGRKRKKHKELDEELVE